MPTVSDHHWISSIIEGEAHEQLTEQEASTPAGQPLEMDQFISRLARRAEAAIKLAAVEQLRNQHQPGATQVVVEVPTSVVQMFGGELVQHAKARGAELGLTEPVIGSMLAAALVYYARECGLADHMIAAVLHSAMAETPSGERVGPVQLELGRGTTRGKA